MQILTHRQIWQAIDALAASLEMSPSGLARKSGLDSTSFNPSKRFTASGRERWPSTESIAKILQSTGTSVDGFMGFVGQYSEVEPGEDDINYRQTGQAGGVPLIGFAQAGKGGFFDDAGFPSGHGWDMIDLPVSDSRDGRYALKVAGDSMLPLYREGDMLVVDPAEAVRPGDRVVGKSRDGEVFAKILARKSGKEIVFHSLNPEHADLSFKPDEIEWMARIVWASQ